jgi:hypothetical protein
MDITEDDYNFLPEQDAQRPSKAGLFIPRA